MSRFWSELTHRLTPYEPGEQPRHPRLVKLNTNESPYAPSPGVMQAIASVPDSALRLYPDPESSDLRAAVARHFGLAPSQVFLGNGSDEVLAHTFQALLKHGDPLLFPDISYSFYPVWCELYGVPFQRIPLREDFSVAPEDYALASGGVIIPNPNAPTGLLLPLEQIRRLLEGHRDAVVVIDEAYIDFGGESAVALIPDFDNLLVIQTLSKSRALAGLRVGLALGQEALIEGLERVKNSFNSYPLDAVAQRAALAAFGDEDYYRECRDRIVASRERLASGLRGLGFEVLPSAANFLFARHPRRDAGQLFNQLRAQGIIVRHFDKPRISQFLRISIGTEEQCQRVLDALEKLLSG